MFISLMLFFLGIIIGFSFLGLIASSKQADLWAAIRLAAYKNDSTLCKKIIDNR